MSTENSVPLTTLSQKEYLKRYLFKGKKKTKKKVVTRSNVKVIDDNDLKASFVEEDADLETGDDAPLIAALIDERPTTIKKLEQFENDSRWAPVPVVNEEVKNPLTKPVEKICGKSLDQFSPEIEPSIPENLRKHTRKREESLTGLSPSRKRKYSANYDSFKNKNTLPENGKPKKKRELSPYEGKKESRMKTSPRSHKTESKSHFEDHSKTSKHSKSKKFYESDDSSSKNRTHHKHDNRNREKDSSSTHSQRDHSICSPEVAKKKRMYGSSNKKHKKSTKSSDSESSLERSSHSKKKKLSDTSKSKSKERKMKSKKKNKDHDRSPECKSESKKLSSSESSKPLARYIDDEDMNEHLKVMIREGDTMLEYLEKKKTKSDSKEGSKHKYKGPFPLNRFGIPPGYRWDGVDRSNGYEKKYLGKDKQKEALEEEAYKWSVSDM